MPHAKISVQNQDGIIGPLERRQQDVGSFGYRFTMYAHHQDPDLVRKAIEARPRWTGTMLTVRYPSNDFKLVVRL
jgi:hypothetical protein